MGLLELKESVYEHIDSKEEILRLIGYDLWKNPEIGLKETFAHNLLTTVLENEGLQVTRHYILETGFRARYQTAEKPHIVYFCEYDALPGIGHACGHNLIAEAGIGAALGLKYAMEHHGIKCKLTVLGSPAEENMGGKISMINENALEGVDVAMMVHPRELNSLHMAHCALKDFSIEFSGRSAHATASPWEGRNALDAATLTYQGVACFRRLMRAECHININLKLDPGNHLGIIPDKVVMDADIRASSMGDLEELERRLTQIAKGAALMADCEVNVEGYDEIYANLVSNKPILLAYKLNGDRFGLKVQHVTRTGGSTDMGNVSQMLPSIHPVYYIGSAEGPHTDEFVKWTGLNEAHELTVTQAKILAATGLDLVVDGSLMEAAINDFQCSASNGFSGIDYADLY